MHYWGGDIQQQGQRRAGGERGAADQGGGWGSWPRSGRAQDPPGHVPALLLPSPTHHLLPARPPLRPPSLPGYALFGSATDGDVLKNLTARFVATLAPPPAAHALVYGVALAFSFNLLVNFVLKVGAGRRGCTRLHPGKGGAQVMELPRAAKVRHGIALDRAAGALQEVHLAAASSSGGGLVSSRSAFLPS